MRRRCALLLATLLVLCAGAGSAATGADARGAEPDDPLQAPDCRSALALLQEQEAAADAAARANPASGVPGRSGSAAELQAGRRLATQICLTSRADPAASPAAPPRSFQPPIVVAPIAPAAVPRSPPAASRIPAPVPAPEERPSTVTACDPGGCWANDGSRLNRLGPNLWGKRGMCTLHGSLLQCP